MTDTKKLASHFFGLPVDARALAARMLRQVAHDVQTPLSTLAMEVFSIRLLLNKLDPSSSAPALERARAFASLNEIFTNMERASSQISEYMNELPNIETSEHADPESG
jgi:hypothetical protein